MPALAGLSENALALPVDILSSLVTSAHAIGALTMRKSGFEISGFMNLLSKPLNATFVWPELNSFNSKSEFFFDFALSAPPVLGPPNNSANKSANKSAKNTVVGAFKAPLNVLVWAPVTPQGQHERMLTFFSPFDAVYRIDLDHATRAMKFEFGSVNLDLSAQWDPIYVQKARNTTVNTKTIGSNAEEALRSESYVVRVGTVPLVSTLKLRLMELFVGEPASSTGKGGHLILQFEE
jgi:hypothetical protein